MEAVLNLIQTVVLLLVLLGALSLILSGRREVRLVLFAFAVVCALLSNLYWLTYDTLRPEQRMPFAANEIGEWAMFLLLGAAFPVRSKSPSVKKIMFFAALFSAANAALWIAWSGEWVEDIITGAVFAYFLCNLFGNIKAEEAFPLWEWRLFFVLCPILVAVQMIIFFVPEQSKLPLDLFCYGLMFGVAALLLIRAFLRLAGRIPGASSAVPEVFSFYAWATITLYMSSGAFYTAALLLVTISFPMMLTALKTEEEPLCKA